MVYFSANIECWIFNKVFSMLIIVIIAVVVLGAVFTALALRHKRNNNNTMPGKKQEPTFPAAAPKESPKDEMMMTGSTAAGPSGSHSGMSVAHKELRQYLISGISMIFDENAPAPEAWQIPRKREQIDPQILKTALDHLAGMDQFRAQQIRLQKLLNDPAVQMTDLSKSITSDPLMTANVLKMANSSYFGVAQKIDSISHALMILGLQNIKNILYREGMRGLFEAGTLKNKAATASLWKHSNLVGVCTQHFYDLFDGLNRGTLFTLGIVHDIGKLVLMDAAGNLKKTSGSGDEYPMDILISEEDQLFGANHAVIGGCALEHWNFSELMTQVVIHHHIPSFVEADQANLAPDLLKYVLALYLSDQMARLFANWNEGMAQIYPLRGSYYNLIDRKKLINKVMDAGFLNQMHAAEAVSIAEHQH